MSGAALVNGLEADAVYSRTPERGEQFAAKTGAKRVFTDIKDLCRSDTDCVYAASPNYAHFEHCKALLLSGKHVICEKPVTTSSAEYAQLLSLAHKNSLVYMEAIMYMHTPARQVLRDAVQSIGRIYSANIDYSQLSSKYPALKRGELPNIFNPQLKTGALNDLGVYCVYPVIDLFGCPSQITPRRHLLDTGADGCGAALFEYEDKLVTVTYSKVGQSYGVSQFIGDNGSVTVSSISQLTGICLHTRDGSRELWGQSTKAQLMGYEAQSFYDFITEPEKHAARLAECERLAGLVMQTMELCR